MGSRTRSTAEFKRESVTLTTQTREVTARIAEDLGLHANVLRKWVKNFDDRKWEARADARVERCGISVLRPFADLDGLRLDASPVSPAPTALTS